MLIFDAHCDTLSKIEKPEGLIKNSFHWDIQRASRYGSFIQVLTCFADDAYRDAPQTHMLAQFEKGLAFERHHPESMKIIRTARDLQSIRQGRVYGILGAEGAEILGGSLEELERLFSLGLRILTLSWNYDNEVCDSVAGHKRHNGLSPLGIQVVRRMEALGMLMDLSHASDKTFEDVMSVSSCPVTASHSNCRALCPHRRNLSDEQIRAIASRRGVIGINFYPPFLESSGNAGIMSIIKHIEHMSEVAGTWAVGLGCDFDGVDRLPAGISGVESLRSLADELLRLNYREEDVRAIMGENYVRLFTQILNSSNK